MAKQGQGKRYSTAKTPNALFNRIQKYRTIKIYLEKHQSRKKREKGGGKCLFTP